MDASERWRILRLHVDDAIPLAALARSTGITERTLQRWLTRYRTGGYVALADGTRTDHGVRRTAADLVRLVEGLALTRPRPSIATIHRQVSIHCAERGLSAPSYSVVRSIVNALDPGMVTLALEGPVSYRDKHEMLLRRRADRPNAIWQADHTMLDLLIVGPDGKPARPWLTVILDDYSRAICGYMVFLGAPSAANTALALRQAIWHKSEPDWPVCGIPDVLYTDHGSDFTSHRLGDTAAVLHLRIIHSQVARPQGRGKIERFFGTINTELLPTLPGHLAPGTAAPAPSLDLAGIDCAINTFVRRYNARTHRELRTSPLQAWIADGWLPRLPESLEQLDGFLLTVPTTRVVQRDGIHFEGLRYTAATLAPFVGSTVSVRYDPRDVTEIRVFHRNAFLCTAISTAHQTETISLKQIQAARNAQRRALRGQIRERIAIVTPLPGNTTPPAAEPDRPRLRTYEEDRS
ncbi:Mu transposase C-terminal domain-containing protein [Curtobacterium pusillum]|uniref:Mu transposase C-terminal domain-containing protein n=1 Tax=Curtobacterium pusillum TaxID=69373 RepID=UPI0011A88DDC|nr:Mu transposase C-terminal domain-containing protein [Curtobacterium pusillum]